MTELSERLRGLFDACEQGSYGGLSLSKPFDELVKEAIDVIRSLDRGDPDEREDHVPMKKYLLARS